MAFTVAQVLAQFGLSYKGVPSSISLPLLNEVDKILVRHFGFRKKEFYVAVTEDSGVVNLDEGICWVESARWIDKPHETPNRISGDELDDSSIAKESVRQGDWRANAPGTPARFMQTHSLTGGQLQFDCPAKYGTLIATAATNASPIVVTTSAAHGLDDGDRVNIRNGLVNTNVNGDYYVNVLTTTTFELYSDEDLTVPVAGNGVYTASSALVGCANSPYLHLYTRWHDELEAGDNIPATSILIRTYSNGMKMLYAEDRDDKKYDKWQKLFENVINEQIQLTQAKAGDEPMHFEVLSERPLGYVDRSRW